MNTFTVNCWKDENKENEVGNGPIVKNIYKNWPTPDHLNEPIHFFKLVVSFTKNDISVY